VARIDEARARVGVAVGDLLPGVTADGEYSYSRASEHGSFEALNGGEKLNLHRAGLGAFWELDLFGGLRRSVESADASMEASLESWRDVLVALYAEVALNYIEVRSLQARIFFAEENAAAQEEILGLVKKRLDAGLVPQLDVHQAQLNVFRTRSVVPALESLLTQAINRLGVLLGEHPGALRDQLLQKGAIPAAPDAVLVGLPANLMRQRPDIRRAERDLAAQTARIGVATAELYPRFAIFGDFGFEAQQLKHLGNWSSRTWSFGPSFSWNIFRGGSIRSAIKAEDARTDQALVRY
jgi:NodT family efflux transporter outer membrane factor (OMF) lipoprotein